MRCPVCSRCLYTADACFEHLFGGCLYVENGENSRVCDWLTGYFLAKTETHLNVLRDVLANYSGSRATCKYCKADAPDQRSLMKHFPCSQRRVGNACELMCELCNFSVPNSLRLTTHLISKHYKCHVCGIWPKNRQVDFAALRNHVQSCDPQQLAFFRCPLCSEHLSMKGEHYLIAHVAKCRRERAERAFDNPSVYGKCDVIDCTDQILLSDIDAHVTKHLRNGDLPSSRQKRLRLSLNDLKSCVINSFSPNTIRLCIGNWRWTPSFERILLVFVLVIYSSFQVDEFLSIANSFSECGRIFFRRNCMFRPKSKIQKSLIIVRSVSIHQNFYKTCLRYLYVYV